MKQAAKYAAAAAAIGIALGSGQVSAKGNQTVTVKPDDTLWSISQLYGDLSVHQLTSLNPDVNPHHLEVGAEVKITENRPNESYHTIKPGDTFYGIARQYANVSIEDLYELNPGVEPKQLHTGTKIKISGASLRERSISKRDAEQRVRKHLGLTRDPEVRIEYDTIAEAQYLIHVYDPGHHHSEIAGWYLVNPETGNITKYA